MLITLQVGRGLAALAVLMYHVSVTLGNSNEVAPYWATTQFGNRGVDFFFVLSGFIIMLAHHSHFDRPSMWFNFIFKRFIRIFPIYWFYTILVVFALLAGFGDFPLPQTGVDWFTSFSLTRVTDTRTPLPQAWTLFHEMLFYFGFSLLIIFRPLGIVVLVFWFTSSAATLHYMPAEREPVLVFFNSYNLNFLLGMGAYYALNYIKKHETLVAALGALFIVLAVISVGFLSYIFFGFGFAFLISAGASIEKTRNIKIPMAILLGNASYSIYLTHEVSIVIFERINGTLNITNNPQLLFFMITLGSLIVGVVSYFIFEKPLLKLLKNMTKSPLPPQLIG